MNDEHRSSLVSFSTVYEFVAKIENLRRVIRASFGAIVEAVNLANNPPLANDRSIWVDAGDRHSSDFADADNAIKRMERRAWQAIVIRLELRRILSIARWTELDKALDHEKLPDITEANVIAFVQGYIDQRETMQSESVREVFNWLRPRERTERAGYKRNNQVIIGPKVILTNAVSSGFGARWKLAYNGTDTRLQALENVLNMLDGRGFASKSHYSALQSAIDSSEVSAGSTDLFHWRAHKNGNLHLTFRRLDLLAELNKRAGGMNLKPAEEL